MNLHLEYNKLYVGNKVYEDDAIADGFYDSIAALKQTTPNNLISSSSHLSMGEDEEYQNIMKIIKNSPQIPSLSRGTVVEILRYLKSSVNDLFSVTAAHYIYAGDAGIDHLLFLMNAAISDLNNLTLDDLSMVWACTT